MSPFPVILSSPSGGGKTTIAHELLRSRSDLGYSVSCTTRAARAGEEHGKDYFFASQEEFAGARARGEFAESAEVHGRLYGTLRREVDRVLASERHVIMDIDVQGARQFIAAYPASVLIFILPPDAETMLRRLAARGSESDESLGRRLKSAILELRSVDIYGYLVVNDDLGAAVKAISGIIDSEELRLYRGSGDRERIDMLVTGLESKIEEMKRSG
ncbi:MAG: guanylate kinase [Gemmatimonadaceae bacterium]